MKTCKAVLVAAFFAAVVGVAAAKVAVDYSYRATRPYPYPSYHPCRLRALSSDATLYRRLTGGNRIGGCYIQTSGGVCGLYAKSAIAGVAGDRGHPKNRRNGGTGCVGTNSFCYFRSVRDYDLTSAERSDMCTSDRKRNAVAQIRHAMRNGACGTCSYTS